MANANDSNSASGSGADVGVQDVEPEYREAVGILEHLKHLLAELRESNRVTTAYLDEIEGRNVSPDQQTGQHQGVDQQRPQQGRSERSNNQNKPRKESRGFER